MHDPSLRKIHEIYPAPKYSHAFKLSANNAEILDAVRVRNHWESWCNLYLTSVFCIWHVVFCISHLYMYFASVFCILNVVFLYLIAQLASLSAGKQPGWKITREAVLLAGSG